MKKIILILLSLLSLNVVFGYKYFIKEKPYDFEITAIAYVCDDYSYSCNSWNAIYTIGIGKEDYFGNYKLYICKGGQYTCNSWNSFYTITRN